MPKVRVEVRLLHSMATAITDGCTPLWPPNMHLSSPLPHRPPVTGKIAMVLAIDDLSCPHRRRGRWRWLWLLRTWRRRISMPQIKWYYYLILGIVDVEANYIVVKAYQYTSLTSVMLLDCWSIPCVILLTWIFLKTKYGLRKFIGVGVCVAGLILVVFSDAHASDRAKGPNPLKGDLFVIAGSMLYAVSNVTEEYFVKKSNRVEVMAMLGVFGAIISGIQISILERQELRSTHWNAGALLPFIGFALAMFLFYSTVPIILKICGATMLNLSLLTSDMWAVLIRIFAYHEKVDWMYFVAFAGTAAGLAIYSYKGSTEAAEDTAQVAGAMDEEAAMENRAARVPGAGDDGPVPNKGFSSTATTSRQ